MHRILPLPPTSVLSRVLMLPTRIRHPARLPYALHDPPLPSRSWAVLHDRPPWPIHWRGHCLELVLFSTGWRLAEDFPLRPGETHSLTVTLPKGQGTEGPHAGVRWSRGEGCAAETVVTTPHTRAWLRHAVTRRLYEPTEVE